MPLFPPDDQYKTRYDDAWKKHVATKLRTETPDLPTDLTDDDIIVGHYDVTRQEVPDITPDDYEQALRDQFEPDFVAPHKSFGETVGPAAHALGSMPGAIARGIAESFASPIQAARAFMTGTSLEETANKLPVPDIQVLRQRGLSDRQIRNIVIGYTATQRSLMQDVEQIGEEGVRLTAEGAANYATLPMGGAAAKGLLKGAATTILGKGAGTAAVGSLAGRFAQHAVTGASIGAAYGAIKGGTVAGAEAAAGGAGAREIFNKTTGGAVQEAAVNALGGAVIGGVLGSAVEGAGSAIAKRSAQEIASRRAVADKALDQFTDSFQPQWLLDRFKSVNPSATMPVETMVDSILAKVLTPEQQAQVTPDKLAEVRAILTKKIQLWTSTTQALDNLVDAGPVNEIPPVGQPVGAPLETNSGVAPVPEPEGVAGPLGSRFPQPVPPEGIEPLSGLEGPGVPVREEPTLSLAPVTPEQRPLPAAQLERPVGVDGQQPAEIAPRDLGPAEVTPSIPVNELALRGPEATARPGGTSTSPVGTVVEQVQNLGEASGVPGQRVLGDVSFRVSESPDSKYLQLDYLENLSTTRGEGGKVLAHLAQIADESRVPIKLHAYPLRQKRGGRIPLEKLVEFYKKYGFRIVEQGDDWADMVRQPKRGKARAVEPNERNLPESPKKVEKTALPSPIEFNQRL